MPHDNSAKYYDFVFERRYGVHYNTLTNSNLTKIKQLLPQGKVLDFGAGTGRLAIPLSLTGAYEVCCVDRSQKMLNVLNMKALEKNVHIKTSLCLDDVTTSDFDLAIAVFTVLAYITDRDTLINVFEQISNLLKHNGLFMFDLESIEGYRNMYNSKRGIVIKDNNETVRVAFTNSDPTLCDYHEESRGQLPSGEHFSYSEDFQIKFWTIEEVREIYHQLGFKQVQNFDFANAKYYVLQKIG